MPTLRSIKTEGVIEGNGLNPVDGGTPIRLSLASIDENYLAPLASNPAGSFTNMNAIIDEFGRVVSASDGTGGTGGTAKKRISVTAGTSPNELTAKIVYEGADIAQGALVEFPVGTYTLTIPATAEPLSLELHGGSGNITTGNEMTFIIIDTDGRSLHFIPGIVNKESWETLDLAPFNPSQDPSVAGRINSLWSNMNQAGSTFMIMLVFTNTI